MIFFFFLCGVGPIKGALIQLPQEKPGSQSNENYKKGRTGWKSIFQQTHPQDCSVVPQLHKRPSCRCPAGVQEEMGARGHPVPLGGWSGDDHEELVLPWSHTPHHGMFSLFSMVLLTSMQGLVILPSLACNKLGQALGGVVTVFFYQGCRVLHLNPHLQVHQSAAQQRLQLVRDTALHGPLYKNNTASCYSMEKSGKNRTFSADLGSRDPSCDGTHLKQARSKT